MSKKEPELYLLAKRKSNAAGRGTAAVASALPSVPIYTNDSSSSLEDDASFARRTAESRPIVSMNGVCCGCMGNALLPSLGITRFQTKRYKENNEYSEDLIETVSQHCEYICNFVHLRLMPAIRPLLQLLYFNENQVEADGLTVISGQIWTAAYLLQSELKTGSPQTLSQSDLAPVKDAFMELAWESEKAYHIDKEFYPIQQRFKKRILPEIWNMEDKYSGSRKDFVDPELREHLHECRPFDSLYTHKNLKLQNQLDLVIISKSDVDISNLSHAETRVSFQQLPMQNKLNLIISLINISISALVRITLSLENHIGVLAEEVVFTDGLTTVRCLESVDVVESSLKKIWKEVALGSQKESEITDRVCMVIDNVNAYLDTTEWLCDRLAEINEMTRLCYECLKYGLKISLPSYNLLVAEAAASYKKRKEENSMDVYMGGGTWTKNYKKDFQDAKVKLLRAEFEQGEMKKIVQRAEHPFTSESLKKVLEVESKFLSTEYHELLQRIPLKIDDMRLIFLPGDYGIKPGKYQTYA